MTASRKGGPSRPGSSRATSVVGEIRKKREKPYRIETKKELGKKRKLRIQTSYQQAPQGFTFLPVGTQDLAERCKELSRQRALPVNVVNAKPVSENAKDPEKISHHIHRIGYHFRSEIVDQAREELGYTLYAGQFIKETDLIDQQQKSQMAAIMRRYGIHADQPADKETPDQVRAAIKELFPKIPDVDLDMIVTHAWKKGSKRVGTNANLDLPRRVQLAVIARIRHRYTDYDQLLRAFEWAEARREVEPDCLKKLIEWRGENDVGDDNELEEIVRETIVIDDDEDEVINLEDGSEADDEDSESDASVEFIHSVAKAEDLRPESENEASRGFFARYQPRPQPQRTQQQNDLARQKIVAARHSLRDAPPAGQVAYAQHAPYQQSISTANRNVSNALVPTNGANTAPQTVIIDGRLHHLEPVHPQMHTRPMYQQYPNHASGPYAPSVPTNTITQPMQQQPVFHQPPPHYVEAGERVVPSIEPNNGHSRYEQPAYPSLHGASPVNLPWQHASKRRRLDHSQNNLQPVPPHDNYRPANSIGQHSYAPRTPPQDTEVIDLITPDRRSRSRNPSPMRDVQLQQPPRYAHQEQYARHPQSYQSSMLHERPAISQSSAIGRPYHKPSEPEPYDPTQPFLGLPERTPQRPQHSGYDFNTGSQHLAASSSRPPLVTHLQATTQYYPALPPEAWQGGNLVPVQQPGVYYDPDARYITRPALTPQPIHGAPAPVQQMPR